MRSSIPFLAALGMALIAPFVASEYQIMLLNYIGLYSIVALGLVLLTGIGGLMSFGQAAFVGLGAYTTAYLSTAANLPDWLAILGSSPWLGLLAGLLVTAVIAFLLGLLTLRLSGITCRSERWHGASASISCSVTLSFLAAIPGCRAFPRYPLWV